MNKRVIKFIFICFCVILIISFSIYFYCMNKNTKSLTGKIININTETFTIISENDCIYTFNITDDFSFYIDDIIKIIYSGELSFFNNVQDVTIINFERLSDFNFAYTGLFEDYYDEAISKVASMSIEEIVGQLFLVAIPITDHTTPIIDYHIGGYLFFENEIKFTTKEELIKNISIFQNLSDIPLLIAVDEEGGKISRLSSNSSIVSEPFLSSQDLYNNGGFEAIVNDTLYKSDLLFELGFNVNLSPVADVTTDLNSYMFDRSFGKDAELTSQYIENVISNTDYRVSYVLKHFPGYGNSLDTHIQEVTDTRTYNSFLENDFLPFQSGIDNGAQGVLVSHNYISCIDGNNPASLSQNVLNILKYNLNFTGIIITDNLSMAGSANIENIYVKAVLAGNNILIVKDYEQAYSEILTAIQDNTISEEYVRHLAIKNIAWKYYKQLL